MVPTTAALKLVYTSVLHGIEQFSRLYDCMLHYDYYNVYHWTYTDTLCIRTAWLSCSANSLQQTWFRHLQNYEAPLDAQSLNRQAFFSSDEPMEAKSRELTSHQLYTIDAILSCKLALNLRKRSPLFQYITLLLQSQTY